MSFLEWKSAIFWMDRKWVFQSGRVSFFEMIGKEFFRAEEAAIKKERKGGADCCCFQRSSRVRETVWRGRCKEIWEQRGGCLNSPTEPSGQQPIHPRILENVLVKEPNIRSFPINQHVIVPEHHWRSENSYTPPGCLVSRLGESFVFYMHRFSVQSKVWLVFFQVELLLY